jgi:hypothetical protein
MRHHPLTKCWGPEWQWIAQGTTVASTGEQQGGLRFNHHIANVVGGLDHPTSLKAENGLNCLDQV